MELEQRLTSFWITFGPWPGDLAAHRIPPFPLECGVTATDIDDALDLIHRGFDEDRELPPVRSVVEDVDRASGLWVGGTIVAPPGPRGIWHPQPHFPDRTVVAPPGDDQPAYEALSIDSLVSLVGADEFARACDVAMAGAADTSLDVPHDLSDRLWYDGDESLGERLTVAIELYRRMPSYGNLMYWRYDEFDEATRERMWDCYREMLGDPREAVSGPVVYSLWVDYFEDLATVERAWAEVAGSQEPRRPRLQRVVEASGPVPWELKVPVYEALASEGGWDDAIVVGLYGSCLDLYGSLDQASALSLLSRLRAPSDTETLHLLAGALESPALPETGAARRAYVAALLDTTRPGLDAADSTP